MGFFLGLAVLLLHQPLFHLGTHLTGDIVTDYYQFHWNYWWIRHAASQGWNIYQTDYVLAPFTSSLAYHTLSVFWYPLWALIEPLGGTVSAMTGIFVTGYTLTGLSMYALLRNQGVSRGLALVGGALLMLCAMLRVAVYWTNVNLLGWFWLPLLLLTWQGLTRALLSPGRVVLWVMALALLLWAIILTDLQYPVFAAFLIVPYALWTLWKLPEWRQRGVLVLVGTVAIGLALVLLTAIGPVRDLLAYDRATLAGTSAAQARVIPFPEGFIGHPDGRAVTVGWLFLPLLLVSLFMGARLRRMLPSGTGNLLRPPLWVWLVMLLPPLMLAPGASMTVNSTTIPLPYTIFHELLGGQFRYPERFLPVFLIPGIVFIMQILTRWRLRHPDWRYALPVGLLLLVMADARVFRSVPIQPQPTYYSFYEAMGAEPDEYVVIEVPTGASSGESLVGETSYSALMWYGTVHGKRMVNGHISRVNTWHVWHMRTDDPLLAWLGQRRFLEPEQVEPQLRRIIPEWPVGYIVVHQDLIGRNGPTTQEIIGYLNSLPDLVCPVWVEGDAVVYRTTWHPLGCPARTPPEVEPGHYVIDIGAPGDERFIGWGWHWPEVVADGTVRWRWTGEYPQTHVYVDVPAGAYTVRLAAQAFAEARTLRLRVNAVDVGEVVTILPDTLQTVAFQVPAELIADGQQVIVEWVYDDVVVPVEAGLGSDPRRLALAIDWIALTREP
jgi:hypothetical protein